jgi:hypothetical protein
VAVGLDVLRSRRVRIRGGHGQEGGRRSSKLNAAESCGKIYYAPVYVWTDISPPYRLDQRNATNAVRPARRWQLEGDWVLARSHM